MRYIVSVLTLAIGGSLAVAGDVPVNWKVSGLGLVSDNKLPAGAKVKIRVSYLDAQRTLRVNGQQFRIEKQGDNFRATVGNDGKVTLDIPGLKAIGPQVTGDLYFQKEGTTGTGIYVTVED
jgi:hypothetical protein